MEEISESEIPAQVQKYNKDTLFFWTIKTFPNIYFLYNMHNQILKYILHWHQFKISKYILYVYCISQNHKI